MCGGLSAPVDGGNEMEERRMEGTCVSCNARFQIAAGQLDDYTECPHCGESANVTTICPHCRRGVTMNGRTIERAFPCPNCGDEISGDTLKTEDGSSMVVKIIDQPGMDEIAAAMLAMQKQRDEEE